jgi:hypothetical protein
MAEGVGLQSSFRTRHPAALGPAVGDRESVRLHHIHGLLHDSPPSTRKVCCVWISLCSSAVYGVELCLNVFLCALYPLRACREVSFVLKPSTIKRT